MSAGHQPEKEIISDFRQEPQNLRNELRLKSCGLSHHAPDDFHRSQWQSEPTSRGFLIYRWFLAAFFVSGVVSGAIIYFHNGVWFIYLTNWGFMLCGLTSICGAIYTTIHHWDTERMAQHTCLIKFYWFCYWTNLILSNIIGLVYWTLIHPKLKTLISFDELKILYNYWAHALPSILFTVDHMIVAHPSRFLHYIYPLALGWAYAVFTYIYYALGGLDVRGLPYIYDWLDYEKPGQAIAAVCLTSVLLIVCSTLQYGLYRLRVFVARKLGKLQ